MTWRKQFNSVDKERLQMPTRKEPARITIAVPRSSLAFREAKRRSGTEYGDKTNSILPRDLARYYTMLRRGRAHLRELFTKSELQFINEALTARSWDEDTIQFLPATVVAHLNQLTPARRTARLDLVSRLNTAPVAALYALADAVEQFARSPSHHYDSFFECLNALDYPAE